MSRRAVAISVLLALAIAAGAAGGYWYAMHRPPGTSLSGAEPGKTGRAVLYWYDPMYPQHRFHKPGKSPFMDMQLVPKYADEADSEGSVSVSSRVVQNLGVRLAEVKQGSLSSRVSAVGSIEYNERSIVLVQPRAAGFIERLHVRAPLDQVRQGAPLVEILIPDWAAAQEEYLLLRKRNEVASADLTAAARQRLVLLGMSEEQIASVESAGSVQPRITFHAPISGVVAELGARQGMTVNAGTTLFRIAGLGTVWVVAEVPEGRANMLTPGSRVEVQVPAYANEKFAGRIVAILPEVNAATRTLRARIEVANPSGKLKPGMYANISLESRGRDSLVVPSEAVIRTAERNVVIVAEGDGKFRAVDVEVGAEGGAETEIRKGLKAGDRVVASGQFLIDSEASLRSTLKRLEGAADPPSAGSAPAAVHKGQGKVATVNAAQGRIELDHAPIPSMKWPAMKMGFAVTDKNAVAKLKPGDAVEFTVRAEPDKNGDYVIDSITPARSP